MIEKIKLTIERGDDDSMSLQFNEDISLDDMVDKLALLMRYLTWLPKSIEEGFAGYLVTKGWTVEKDKEND